MDGGEILLDRGGGGGGGAGEAAAAGAPERRRRRSRSAAGMRSLREAEERSEWWVVDGEMHWGERGAEGEVRDSEGQSPEQAPEADAGAEHEPWCKRYIELYQELRENWERLYWDEGYSKKLAQDHANYDSAEDDDLDFSPYSICPYEQPELASTSLTEFPRHNHLMPRNTSPLLKGNEDPSFRKLS
ncbi:hypothetical protein Syun_030409 [Stephania yunnanensis]|uniref:Uncharacterized protein n=1 Tax=Stephania yunnanensis TaxID=152371 RepID=A0AAP0E787_9MAGN